MPIGIVTPATGVLLLFSHKQLAISFNLVYYRANVNLQRSDVNTFNAISLKFSDFFKCNFSQTFNTEFEVQPTFQTYVKEPEEPTEIVDEPEEPTEIVDEQEEPTEIVEELEEPTDIVEEPEEPTDIVEEPEEPTDIVEEPDQQTIEEESTNIENDLVAETTAAVEDNIHWFIIVIIIALFVATAIACGCLILICFHSDIKKLLKNPKKEKTLISLTSCNSSISSKIISENLTPKPMSTSKSSKNSLRQKSLSYKWDIRSYSESSPKSTASIVKPNSPNSNATIPTTKRQSPKPLKAPKIKKKIKKKTKY